MNRPLYAELKAHYPDRFHVDATQLYTRIGHSVWDAVEVWFWPLQ